MAQIPANDFSCSDSGKISTQFGNVLGNPILAETGALIAGEKMNQWYKDIVWSRTVKKESRGLDAFDFGEVQAVAPHYVKTEKGLFNKETFYLPRDLAEVFDGSTLWFRIAPERAEEFRRETPPTGVEYAKYSLDPFWAPLLESLSKRNQAFR